MPKAPSSPHAAEGGIKGTIIETMNTGGYTYLKLDAGKEPVWVAIPETKVEKGQEVHCLPGMEMKDFSSKTLNRTFPSIIFSPGLVGSAVMMNPHKPKAKQTAAPQDSSFAAALQAEQQHNSQAVMPSEPTGGSPGSLGAMVPSMDISVAKAQGENSYTVGECYAKAKELDQQQILIRGKVVKVSTMIMGRNWVHIQDGTGSPMENTHDLVITTQATPEEGAVVTFTGTLHANRDFGAGYSYAVIIEEGMLKQ